jgi:hypothetical protein
MKQFILTLFVALVFSSAYTQSIDEIRKLIEKADWAGAKKAIDGHLSDAKNAAKSEGWYYKGVIYNECSKKEETKGMCTDCKADAFEAFKKYQLMDPKNVYMTLEQNVRLFDLYNGYFDLASKSYSEKKYEEAYNYFKGAYAVEDYIRSKNFEYNGFKFGAVDTSLTLNMALSARLANKHSDAIVQYQKLADLNLNGDDHLEMYQYLAEQYGKMGNTKAFEAALAQGKRLYPDNEYWLEAELDLIDKKDKNALLAKYDELVNKNPNNYALSYNYAVELFNHIYIGETKPANASALQEKLQTVIAKAIAIKNTADANMLMARHLYNTTYDKNDEMKGIKGTKPEDLKKKAELRKLAMKMADECIMHANTTTKIYAAMEKLKPVDKANYKNAMNILESMYAYKGDAAKAAAIKKQAETMQ